MIPPFLSYRKRLSHCNVCGVQMMLSSSVHNQVQQRKRYSYHHFDILWREPRCDVLTRENFFFLFAGQSDILNLFCQFISQTDLQNIIATYIQKNLSMPKICSKRVETGDSLEESLRDAWDQITISRLENLE